MSASTQPLPNGDPVAALGGRASRVLAGIDHSRTAMRAVSYAAGLARRQGSSLMLVHVASPRPSVPIDPLLAGSVLTAAADDVTELWARIGDEVDLHGLRVEVVTVRGQTTAELCRIACDCDAEAVVVGASEQFRHRWLGGSVGARLAARHLWPVVVVP